MSSEPMKSPSILDQKAISQLKTPPRPIYNSIPLQTVDLTPPRPPIQRQVPSLAEREALRATINYNVPVSQRMRTAAEDIVYQAGFEIGSAFHNPAGSAARLGGAVSAGATMSAEIAGSMMREGGRQSHKLLRKTRKKITKRGKTMVSHALSAFLGIDKDKDDLKDADTQDTVDVDSGDDDEWEDELVIVELPGSDDISNPDENTQMVLI